MSVDVSVVGAGFARTAILPALRNLDDVNVVALASSRVSSARRTASEFGVEAAYDDWQAMLRNHRADLVCIATPTALHAPMAIAALEAGAHVLCEKPMALDRNEARRMLREAESLGRIHMIDHELRFNPNRRRIKELIDSGYVGKVRHVELIYVSANFGDPASRRKGDWLSLAELGGGRLGANGSHQVDLLRWWFGEVDSVSARLTTLAAERVDPDSGERWTATADDYVSCTVQMKSGELAEMVLSSVARHDMGTGIRIFGSEGTILLSDRDEKLLVARAGEEFQDMTQVDENASLPGVVNRVWNVSVVALLTELVGAIRESRPLREGATFEDGLKCQEVLDAARLSSRERRWVAIDEVARDAQVTP